MRIMAVFAAVALAELWIFMAVESQIGLGNALLIALATAVAGSALVRRAGIAVMGDFRAKLESGTMPGRELSHGAAILVAGALLISPGFLTDAIGFLLLVPAVRDVVHRRLSARLTGRVTVLAPPSHTSPVDDREVIDVESWEEI